MPPAYPGGMPSSPSFGGSLGGSYGGSPGAASGMMSAGSSGYSASSARTAPRARYGTGAGAWDGTSAVSAAWAQQQAALGLALQGQATVAMLGLQR